MEGCHLEGLSVLWWFYVSMMMVKYTSFTAPHEETSILSIDTIQINAKTLHGSWKSMTTFMWITGYETIPLNYSWLPFYNFSCNIHSLGSSCLYEPEAKQVYLKLFVNRGLFTHSKDVPLRPLYNPRIFLGTLLTQ